MQTSYPSHPSAGAPAFRHIYRDAEGAPVLIANRYEPKGKAKFFLPYDLTRQAWKAPAQRPLYNLDKIARDPQAQVWFVEGEKCADALSDLGFLATTSFGGCKALAKTDLYLNLGDKDWRGVAIDAQGWQVLDRPPVRFQRSSSMMALPLPVRHSEGIEALRPFLNVATEADFKLLVSWLIGCFHPRGPYPILILTGEQGSAKSTTARVLRSLIDPANPIARSAPYSEQDLVIAAKHNHVMAFDNLSTIKPATADALCRIATGGGFGTRKLHSDTDEVLFTATRPILLNGIPDLANRPDLADRALIVTLPVISATNREFEAEFWKAFERAAPGILAALLDGVSTALRRIGTVTLPERPRMADFAKWVTAAEPAFAWPDGAFMEAYASNRKLVQDAAIDGNPLAEAILLLVQDHGPWSGTATDLLKALRTTSPLLTDDAQSFPRHPNRLSSELRRLLPLLRHRGVTLSVSREGKAGLRLIHIATA